MAVNADFKADFSSFLKAIDQAQIALVDFGKGASTVETKLNRMVDNFSGRKLIQEASLLTIAVEKAGGIANLTAKELEQVGAKANEAAEKMQKLGYEVPKGLQDLANSTKKVATETSGWGSALSVTSGILGAMGIDLAVNSLVNFAKGAVHSAAALGDLSTATGISTDELQKLAYAGTGFGLSMDTISTAVQKLSADLAASGPNSAKGAVEALGLSVERLVAAGPEEAFLQISDAVARIEDPMLRSSVAADVFGAKLSKDLNPSLGKMREEMEKVPKDALISPEVIQSANDFEAAIGRGVTRMEAWLLKAAEITGGAAKKVGEALAASGGGPMDQATFTAYLDQAAKMEAAANGVLAANQTVATSMTALVAPVATATTKAQMYANELALLRTHAIEPLTAAQKAQVDELLSYGKSHEWIASRVEGVTVPAIELYIKAQKDAADETKQNAADMKKAWEDLTHFREAADKRELEIIKALQAEETKRAGVVNEQVTAELNARIKLNAAYGLDAEGHVKMGSALDTYNTKLDALHKKKQEGIDQYAQEQVLMDEYTTALYDEAVANDKAAEAERKAKEAKDKSTESTDKATKAAGVYMNQLHMLVSDPKLAAFFGGNVVANSLYSAGSGGFTPEEAAAMAAGQFINFAASAMATGWKGFGTRAAGGPVSAGTPYMVGERGPELFVPGQSGRIAAGGVTVSNVFNVNGTAQDVARQIADILNRQVMQGRKLSGS